MQRSTAFAHSTMRENSARQVSTDIYCDVLIVISLSRTYPTFTTSVN